MYGLSDSKAASATQNKGTFLLSLKKIRYVKNSTATGVTAYASVSHSREKTQLARTKHGEIAKTFCLANTRPQKSASDRQNPKSFTDASKNMARHSTVKLTAVFLDSLKSKDGKVLLCARKTLFFMQTSYRFFAAKIFCLHAKTHAKSLAFSHFVENDVLTKCNFYHYILTT